MNSDLDSEPDSQRPVLAALVGNGFLTVIKFFAALTSGSGTLFAEAIHSVADTSNQALLLIGIRRSRRQPDKYFAYGYASERFFWALLSACGIFFVGAGVTVYHGIESFIHPPVVSFEPLSFVVLACAFVIELYTLWIAARVLQRSMPEETWRERLREGDPSTLAVLFEDSVAVLGVMIASVTSVITYATGQVMWDSLGSIIIGILLGIVAIVLIMKNRTYLLGKSIPIKMEKEILKDLENDPTIESVLDFKSEVLDVGVYRVKCEIEFNGSALLKELYRRNELREQYEEIQDNYEEFKRFCANYADRVPRLMGRHIDAIEQRLKERYPEVKYIDMEIN